MGTARRRRPWQGQLYGDDLAATAAVAPGQHHSIDLVRSHSREWGWSLNKPKMTVMLSGDAASRRAAAAAVSRWGDAPLARGDSEQYLEIDMHEART